MNLCKHIAILLLISSVVFCGVSPGDEVGVPENLPIDVNVINLQSSGTLPPSGMIALNSIRVKKNGRLNGDLQVINNCVTPCPGDAEINLAENVTLASLNTIRANRVNVETKSLIYGTLEGNQFNIAPDARVENVATPLGNTAILPVFLVGMPGKEDIKDTSTIIEPGKYRNLKIDRGNTALLSGGYYHFQNIEMRDDSSIICEELCYLLVQEKMETRNNVKIASLSHEADLVNIYIEGLNTRPNSKSDSSAKSHHNSLRTGRFNNFKANFYAPNGTMHFGNNSELRGIIIGKDIILEKNIIYFSHLPASFLDERKIYKTEVRGELIVVEINRNSEYRMITSRLPTIEVQGFHSYDETTKILHLEPARYICSTCTLPELPATSFSGIPPLDLQIAIANDGTLVTNLLHEESGTPIPLILEEVEQFSLENFMQYVKVSVTVNYPPNQYNGRIGLMRLEGPGRSYVLNEISNNTAVFNFLIESDLIPNEGVIHYNIDTLILDSLESMKLSAVTGSVNSGVIAFHPEIYKISVNKTTETIPASFTFGVKLGQ